MSKERFTWGETVVVSASAPKEYRPGNLAEVCSIWEIKTKKKSMSRGEPVGTVFYSIEFGDGTLMDIPECFLEKQKNNF